MVTQKDKASLMDAFVDELEERMAIRAGVANRQQPAGEGLGRIETDQVEIAVQASMLKAVVDQDQVDSHLDQPPRAGHPIGVLHLGEIGEASRQEHALVVECSAPRSAVAPRQHSGLVH